MAKIITGEDGKIILPDGAGGTLHFQPGTSFILEPSERGLSLYLARPDARRAYIEVTTGCNLSCEMCVRQVWGDPQGKMSSETFAAVVQGLKTFPLLGRVFFGGYGEPLTHPNIVDMIAEIRALGVGVTLSTNGLLLNQKMAQTLLKTGVDTLVVSLDSMHVQAYKKAGGNGGSDRVLRNLEGLSELMRDGGFKLPALGLEYVATRSNLEELYGLPQIAKKVGASFIIVTNLLPHTRDLAADVLYDRAEPLRLGGGWGVQRAGWIAWGSANLPRMKWGAARQCRFINEDAVVVGWDGAVVPCYALLHSYTYYMYGRRKDVTRYSLGNVRETPLSEIWMSEEYVKFRAKVHDFRFPSCIECGMDCTFAQENTDCWGNEPSCADCLWAQDIIRCP